MRRSDMEFKSEVLRRAAAYRARQRQLRKKLAAAALCFVLVCTGVWGLGHWGLSKLAMGGTSSDCTAAENMNLASGKAESGLDLGRNEMEADAIEPAEGAEAPAATEYCVSQSTGASNGASCRQYNVVSIEVNTLPESEDRERVFTEEEEIVVIETAIEWIYTVGVYDENVVLPGGGTVYRIVVTYGDSAVSYELYSGALYCESDDTWITMEEDAYQRLVDAISQEDGQ